MIARIKGLKISQATERVAVTGLEMIPFQDGERNGKIRMIEFKDMTMYVFDPTIVDGKISQEDYDNLKKAIEEGKLIYTINTDRTGLLLATEVSVDHGNIHMKSPGFKQETGTDNISLVIFDTTDINADLNYDKTSYATPALQTTGDGNKVLTNDGSYEYIGNLALTNIKFKDDSNTSVYDLITEAITFQQDNTPCVSWSTTKNGNNIYMKLNIAKANSNMDGLLSKEDYVELNTTIPNQIEDLQNQGEELENKIDQEIQDRKDEVVRLDGRINQEIADRKSEISRVDTKYLVITDNLNQSLQQEISDRKAADNTITDNLNAFKNTKGQPGGLAELDSTGKVPASLLPSYVDDVIEYPTLASFPATGETGKIYVARDTNLTYRWSGNQYIEISKSLALGETSSTAYPGDKGKANRDALNSTPTNLISSFDTTTTTNELVKVNYKYVAKNGLNYSQPQDANVDIPAATESSAGAMTSIDKTRLNHLHDEFGTLNNPGDKLNSLPANLVTEIGEVTRDANKATINYKLSVLSQDNSYSIPNNRTTVIPAATDTLAGLMTPTDKTQFDRVNTANFTLSNVTTDANTASINATKTDISTGNTVTNNVTIPAVTTTKAGVMTAADKVNLDTTIPNRITTLDNRVTTEVNNLNTAITNSSSNLTDTMNTELAKKVGKVTVAGSGNAVTTASISGDTLTLTKGATYNNYVHPAGSAPSKITGFYKFSTDSTSHISGVTAVTKDDIVNLGIYDSSAADSKFVTLSTAQTITGKKTFAGGIAITDGEENPNMPFFLGIDAFNDGGTVKWITAAKVANAIGVYTKNEFTWSNLLNKPTTLAGYGITDAASTSALTDHINNTTVHITSAERTKWNKVVTDFAAITGNDSDEIINKWEEVVAFLDNYTEANTLSDLLSHKADKTVKISAGAGITGGGDLSANRTLSLATSGVTAGTYTKMTVDQYGRVTAGATLSADDIPGLPWSKITSGKPTAFPTNWANVANKPTTLAGYGITDAYTKSDSDSRYVNVAGDTMTGRLNVDAPTAMPIMLNKTIDSDDGDVCIRFKLKDNNKADIGYNSTYGTYIFNASCFKYLGIKDDGTPHFQNNTLWHAGNDGSGSGLDADLLDGYHEYSFFKYNGYWSNNDTHNVDNAVGMVFAYPSHGAPNNCGVTTTFEPTVSGDYKSQFHHTGLSNSLYFRSQSPDGGGWTSWREVAGTDSNVASASKLLNKHYLWGQLFDGTADVSGDMIGIAGGIAIHKTNEINCFNGNLYLNHRGNGDTLGTTSGIIMCANGGNVGIGTTSMPYKLNVNGATYSTGGYLVPYSEGNWISMATRNNCIAPDLANSTTSAHCLFRLTFNNGNRLCFGGLGDELGFFAFSKSDVDSARNSVYWKAKWNSDGAFFNDGKISSPAGFWKESDIRLKSDIKPLTYTLDLICSIPTNSFIMNNTKQIGTIALELESIGFNELVSEDKVSADSIDNKDTFEVFNENDTEYVKVKRVEYEMLSVIAIEGVKLLKDEIDKLKAEIENLKDKHYE